MARAKYPQEEFIAMIRDRHDYWREWGWEVSRTGQDDERGSDHRHMELGYLLQFLDEDIDYDEYRDRWMEWPDTRTFTDPKAWPLKTEPLPFRSIHDPEDDNDEIAMDTMLGDSDVGDIIFSYYCDGLKVSRHCEDGKAHHVLTASQKLDGRYYFVFEPAVTMTKDEIAIFSDALKRLP